MVVRARIVPNTIESKGGKGIFRESGIDPAWVVARALLPVLSSPQLISAAGNASLIPAYFLCFYIPDSTA